MRRVKDGPTVMAPFYLFYFTFKSLLSFCLWKYNLAHLVSNA